ncbi:MAG: flagellar biosynthesis protein FlhA, partial [bacterium]
INEQQAVQRRKEIRMEADFYGSMDGASKFVKGDAIAAIVIIFINILGGLVIGVMQKGMTAGQALQTYTLLTVGEGLVNQVPALLISTSTGILVTRAATDSNMGADLIGQMLNQPRILYMGAGILSFLSLVPGLPKIPFWVLAAALASLAYVTKKNMQETVINEEEEEREKELEEVKKPESVISLLPVDPLELEIGYSLIPLVDPKQGGDLLDRITLIRRQCALELGLVVPAIRIRDNMQLKPNIYVIKIAGLEIAQGELMVGHYMAMDPGTVIDQIAGIETTEPAFGLPALWIKDVQRSQAEMAGYTVVDLPSIVATHITEIVKSHAYELLGRQDVQSLLDSAKETHSAVIEELVPNVLSLGEIQKVLQNLLKEGVSIRNLGTILETLADYGRLTKDTDVLTEYVRQSLARYISKHYQTDENSIAVITLDPKLEQLIAGAIQTSEYGSYVAIEPSVGQKIFNKLAEETQKVASLGYQPIVLTSPNIRMHFKRLTERVAPNLIVLSYNELDSSIKVQSVGMVKI